MSVSASVEDFADADVEGGDGAVGAEDQSPFYRDRPWWWLAAAIAGVIVALIMAAISFAHYLIEERKEIVLAGVEGRLQALASGRAETIGAWLEAKAATGRRLSHSELVQLFVAESSLAANDRNLEKALGEQRPYLRQVVDEFAAQQSLVGIYIFDAESSLVLRDRDAPDPMPMRFSTTDRQTVSIGAPRSIGKRIVVDVGLPIPAPQRFFGDTDERVGQLVMTLDASERFERALSGDELSLAGERAVLQFDGGDGARQLWVNEQGARVEPMATTLATADALNPAIGADMDGDAVSFFKLAKVPGTTWMVVQEQRAEEALASVHDFAIAARWSIAAGLVLFGATLATLLLWQRAKYLGRLVRVYRDLAGRLMQQKKLLKQVTTATRDWISVKDREGRFLLVNPAFVSAVGCTEESIIGKTEDQVLPPSTRAALAAASGQQLSPDGELASHLSEETALEIGGDLHHLEVASNPIIDEHGQPCGTLTVFHDVTDLAIERQRRNYMLQRTVGAFQRAVELIDPYLLGHSHRLQETAIQIAQCMRLSDKDVEAVRLAAGLSQIGKLFVPKDIVAKQGRHDAHETEIMQQHIQYATDIVAVTGLPDDVRITLSQMHERLDGTGYPCGLSNRHIGITGRILAVADVFCARTAPRSYRDRLNAAQVMAHLRDNQDRYDMRIVDALEQCHDKLAWAVDEQPEFCVES